MANRVSQELYSAGEDIRPTCVTAAQTRPLTHEPTGACVPHERYASSARPEPPLSPLALCRRRLKSPTKLLFLSKRLGARAAVAFEQAEALLTLPCGTW
eukprot:scaffold42687_cov72-Phaeocystis_antarctica.AAC.1